MKWNFRFEGVTLGLMCLLDWFLCMA